MQVQRIHCAVEAETAGCGRGGGGGMVDVAESILRDYRHGLERTDDEGACEGAGIGCVVGDWCQNSEFFRYLTPRRRHGTQINNSVEKMSALNNFKTHEVL